MNEMELSSIEDAIAKLEQSLIDNKKKLAELRRSLLKKEVTDFTFRTHEGANIQLSELFGDSDELILVHNMGRGCVYCTLWADGFNSLLPHLEDRASFVVVSPDEHDSQKEFYHSRNWKFRMYSSHNTSFFKEMGFEAENGSPQPGVSTFFKSDDKRIFRIANASFGPGDDFCSVWHLFDLLPNGNADWSPKYKY